jgi:crossover junction endodeoxyribonuclease RuvC
MPDLAEPVRIIGIDPGSRITGYGIIEKIGNKNSFIACGVIKPDPKLPFSTRLKEIHDGIETIIWKQKPQRAAIEDIFVSKNARSALKLGHARGAIIIAAINNGVSVAEYTPRLVKQSVVGYGNAAKTQVQHMVRALLNLPGTPSEDAADALAVAICHANHNNWMDSLF